MVEHFQLPLSDGLLKDWISQLNFTEFKIPNEQKGYEIKDRAQIESKMLEKLQEWLKDVKTANKIEDYTWTAHIMYENDGLLWHHDGPNVSLNDQILIWFPLGPFKGRDFEAIHKPSGYKEKIIPSMGRGIVMSTQDTALWHRVTPHLGGAPVITLVGYVGL